jgi:hypothetical protein
LRVVALCQPGFCLILVQVFVRDIVFLNLVGMHLGHVRIWGILNAFQYFCLEELPFLDKFLDALRARFRVIPQTLDISRLTG